MSRALEGMANIFWCSVWADCAEHAYKDGKRYRLSGERIEDHAGDPPEHAFRIAERIRGTILQANGMDIASLFAQALRADVKPLPANIASEDFESRLFERFGECLAYMCMGAGVSWFDDHEQFPLITPLTDCQDELTDLACAHLASKGYVVDLDQI